MAATVTTNATNPLPTGQGFGGDEFSNNLFSDLAPLLTLFGEQVTKQFLSMSMGWADDVLLAMGPLGIMTVIVSAIRVGGVKVLKAFVGRARESRANAEKEILSSTSADVCELWSGQEIVRELGNPEGMKDLILLREPIEIGVNSRRGRRRPYARDAETEPTRVLDITSAVSNNILTSRHIEDEELINISNGAPNIALNVRNSTASPRELIAFAVVGTLLQLGGLVFPAVTTYYLKWTKGGSAIAGYGYPCFATGTAAVIVGMIFCGRVIEGSTTEHEFGLSGRDLRLGGVQIMRLQRACTVSDQHFPSYAIFNSPEDIRIRTSRLNRVDYSRMAAFGTLTAVIGFVAQFVGLRALHWSATIFQLGIMLIMTVVRSWVRRGLAADPKFYALLDGHELAWLTLYILGNDDRGWTKDELDSNDGIYFSRPSKGKRDSQLRGNAAEKHATVGQSDGQFRRSSETDLSQIAEVSTPGLRFVKWNFITTFPYIVWNKSSQEAPDPQPEDEMLDSIVRWEPLTGYWSVRDLKQTLSYTPPSFDAPRIPKSALNALKVERSRLARAFCRLPKSIAMSNEDIQADIRPLDIYRDLQRLTPTANEAVDSANNLALAMERTMAFLARCGHVLWHDGQDPFVHDRKSFHGHKTLGFSVNIMLGSYDPKRAGQLRKLELQLTRKRPDPEATVEENEQSNSIWTANRDILSAVLSMWLFALELRKAAAIKAATALRRINAFDLMSGPRYDPSRDLVSRRNVYFRILSPGQRVPDDRDNRTSENTLIRWLPGRIEAVPLLGRQKMEEESDWDDGFPPEPDNSWVVWNSSLSGLFDPQISRFMEGADHKRNDLAIRTRPDTTIAGHCALDLFGYFMDAIVARIEKLGGRTRPVNEPQLIDGPVDRWSNSVFESIANECVTAGLAHDLAEAYTVIIPTFMKHKLLPTRLHSEVKFVREGENAIATFQAKDLSYDDAEWKMQFEKEKAAKLVTREGVEERLGEIQRRRRRSD